MGIFRPLSLLYGYYAIELNKNEQHVKLKEIPNLYFLVMLDVNPIITVS